jgi:hypothetical protein
MNPAKGMPVLSPNHLCSGPTDAIPDDQGRLGDWWNIRHSRHYRKQVRVESGGTLGHAAKMIDALPDVDHVPRSPELAFHATVLRMLSVHQIIAPRVSH